ncbi:helix-turn-helix domain-containing protein [Haloarcula onubensis]|uniref:Helix-turn-helix domain-containing protein n=1 Tax=Haloarcula onubensis TaxID=2950539 RepID=A0ABU2FR53_9EURY|nr:helix-turn-helix domain-containing protein [Halomicroarcula sp. S3CR25-11]MDS0282889.1 helix-turn-helix domain-containing protein [Halomicroarcula sp. S3CR25-11]
MVRDPVAEEETPELTTVLDALDDEDCRKIVGTLDEPMTASEVSEASGVPLSTTYRKLELLTDAALLHEGVEVRADGQHASRYAVDFEAVVIALDEARQFDVEIDHLARSPDERLENLWSEVRKET